MLGNHNSNRNKSHTQLFSEITKQSPTKIIIQTGNETHTNTVIDNTDHNTQTMKTNINNVHFGNDIGQDPQKYLTRIFFQNVNGLAFSTTTHTLLATCIGMQDKQIAIACLAETNTNWNHYKGKRHLKQIVLQHWKGAHITTLNLESKVKTIYQLGGTSIISTNKISHV